MPNAKTIKRITIYSPSFHFIPDVFPLKKKGHKLSQLLTNLLLDKAQLHLTIKFLSHIDMKQGIHAILPYSLLEATDFAETLYELPPTDKKEP